MQNIVKVPSYHLKIKMSQIMTRSYLRFSYLLFWIILPFMKGNYEIFEKSLVTVNYCKSCYLFNAYGVMSLKISKVSHWNASLYNSALPWPKYDDDECHKQPKNKNFDNFLQSVVAPLILFFSVGTMHFEGECIKNYSAKKKPSIDLQWVLKKKIVSDR